MDNEHLSRTFNVLPSILASQQNNSWFVSFGSLLNLVRDRGKLSGDLDLSMMYGSIESEERFLRTMLEYGYHPKEIIKAHNGSLLKMCFKNQDTRMFGDYNIDIFFWFQAGDYLYHSYDYFKEGVGPDNTLCRYMCKGTPVTYFDGGRIMAPWPGTKYEIPIPLKFGHMLDYWYPNWLVEMVQFGVDSTSMSKAMVEVDDPEELMENCRHPKIMEQIAKSTEQYWKLVDRMPGVRRI